MLSSGTLTCTDDKAAKELYKISKVRDVDVLLIYKVI